METGRIHGKASLVVLSAMFAVLFAGEVLGAKASRQNEDTSWAASVLRESAEALGTTGWKLPSEIAVKSATRMAQSQTGTGLARDVDTSATAPVERIDVNEEYISIRRANPSWKKPKTQRISYIDRVYGVEKAKDDTRTVTVRKVRPGKPRPVVRRVYPDDEGTPEPDKIKPPNVVKAVGEAPEPQVPPVPRVNPAPAVSATKPAVAAAPPQLPSLAPAKTPVPVAKAEPPVNPAPVALPPKPAKPVSASTFMASQKPAPVEEEKPAKPPEEKKTGVPVSSDAKSEFRSEMMVVSPAGKPIRMTSYLMAKNLLKDGDYIEAQKYAKSWLEKNPEDWRGWQLLGNIQVELGAYGKALNSYRKSLAIHPDNPTLRHYVDQAEGIEK